MVVWHCVQVTRFGLWAPVSATGEVGWSNFAPSQPATRPWQLVQVVGKFPATWSGSLAPR